MKTSPYTIDFIHQGSGVVFANEETGKALVEALETNNVPEFFTVISENDSAEPFSKYTTTLRTSSIMWVRKGELFDKDGKEWKR